MVNIVAVVAAVATATARSSFLLAKRPFSCASFFSARPHIPDRSPTVSIVVVCGAGALVIGVAVLVTVRVVTLDVTQQTGASDREIAREYARVDGRGAAPRGLRRVGRVGRLEQLPAKTIASRVGRRRRHVNRCRGSSAGGSRRESGAAADRPRPFRTGST